MPVAAQARKFTTSRAGEPGLISTKGGDLAVEERSTKRGPPGGEKRMEDVGGGGGKRNWGRGRKRGTSFGEGVSSLIAPKTRMARNPLEGHRDIKARKGMERGPDRVKGEGEKKGGPRVEAGDSRERVREDSDSLEWTLGSMFGNPGEGVADCSYLSSVA